LEKYFFQVCHTHLKLDLEGMHLISLQNNIINSRWFLYMSQKMMQTQVCKGSNHVRVIPQEKQRSYTHTCTHAPSTYQSC